MDYENELANELAAAAVGWYATRLDDEQLSKSIEATFKRFGPPERLLDPTVTFNARERPASELCAPLAWEMTETGRAMHDVVLSVVERAG